MSERSLAAAGSEGMERCGHSHEQPQPRLPPSSEHSRDKAILGGRAHLSWVRPVRFHVLDPLCA